MTPGCRDPGDKVLLQLQGSPLLLREAVETSISLPSSVWSHVWVSVNHLLSYCDCSNTPSCSRKWPVLGDRFYGHATHR